MQRLGWITQALIWKPTESYAARNEHVCGFLVVTSIAFSFSTLLFSSALKIPLRNGSAVTWWEAGEKSICRFAQVGGAGNSLSCPPLPLSSGPIPLTGGSNQPRGWEAVESLGLTGGLSALRVSQLRGWEEGAGKSADLRPHTPADRRWDAHLLAGPPSEFASWQQFA